MEVLLYQVNELLMANTTGTYNNHVLTEVVGLEEINDHIAVDLIYVINVTKDGLAHHVLSENIEVDIFHQGLHMIVIGCLQLLPDSFLLHLKVVVVVIGVADHIAENLN